MGRDNACLKNSLSANGGVIEQFKMVTNDARVPCFFTLPRIPRRTALNLYQKVSEQTNKNRNGHRFYAPISIQERSRRR
jgi:hypothetical protein